MVYVIRTLYIFDHTIVILNGTRGGARHFYILTNLYNYLDIFIISNFLTKFEIMLNKVTTVLMIFLYVCIYTD